MLSQMVIKQFIFNLIEYIYPIIEIGWLGGKWSLDKEYWPIRRLFLNANLRKLIAKIEGHVFKPRLEELE